MSKAEVFTPTLERLSQLVMKQYGCDIKFLDFNTIRGQEYRPYFMTLCRGERAITDERLFFPIVMDQQLTGAAELSLTSPLSDKDIHRLDHTVRMILQSSLENMSRLDTLEILEKQMKAMQDRDQHQPEDTVNVINLTDRRKARSFNPAEIDDDSELAFLETMSFPFLIEAQNEEDAFKMALEIHQMSGRRIFLPIEDLSAETFESPSKLRELGSATLYTRNIEKLNSKIQSTIVDYYQGERQKDDPQIIVGTVQSYSELKKSEKILPDLINRLAVGYLFMRQSFNDYKSDNLMEFFIDSLTGRIDRQ